MNQILVTQDDQIKEKNNKKSYKEKKILPAKSITIFYAICIIILGICMICGSVYTKNNINRIVDTNIKPTIRFEESDDKKLTINIDYIKNLKSVTYKLNDEDEVIINGNNRKKITETITLKTGKNEISVSAIGENGQKKTDNKTIIVGSIPEIDEFEPIENGIKVVARSEEGIKYVQYCWDNGEMQKIEVNDKQYEGIINILEGRHTLKVEVIDINGTSVDRQREIIGDVEPTVNVKSEMKNGKMVFTIEAEDDEKITTLSIIHNGGEEQIININDKKYNTEVLMTEGEENTIIVTATNINNLQKTRRIKFTNK